MGRRYIGVLVAAGMLALAGSVTARAGIQATLASRDLQRDAVQSASRFELVGLHWRGSGRVSFRTRSLGGRWTAWRDAAPEAEDLPDARSAEGLRSRGWRLGNPYWVGPSDRIQWRAHGTVKRVRAFFVRSPVVAVPPRAVDSAGSPRIVMRSAWSADEKIRRAAPRYAPAVRYSVVHHTAGGNAYGPEESAAIVRGIEIYHVKGNGWNDIGYNFLVDRYGQVFEGRFGGVTRNVVGAHAAGFNTGSTGVAVMGTYGSKQVSPEAEAALIRLLAWRLDLAHADPVSRLTIASGGNGKYPAGTPVMLRAVSGHRDTGFTECPGAALYTRLPAIAAGVAVTGLPKLYDPTVRGALADKVTFTARLSSPQVWKVTVRDALGGPVASGSGTGSSVKWVWDARFARDPSYSWSIEAPSLRAASGLLRTAAPAPAPPPRPLPGVLTEFSAGPATISPDGDGVVDFATITYRLRRSALVTATVVDAAGATSVSLFQDQRQSARVQSWSWNADAVPDGRYTLVVTAQGGDGKIVSAQAQVLVDRTLGFLSAVPPVFSPNGDGLLDTITFGFDLGAPATVTVRVVQYGREVALVYSGGLQPGTQRFVWNGQSVVGTVPDGQYDLVVTAVDALAETRQSMRFTVDSRAQ